MQTNNSFEKTIKTKQSDNKPKSNKQNKVKRGNSAKRSYN